MASNLKRERLNFIKKINQRIKRLEESGIDRNIILDLISDKNLPNVKSNEGRVSIPTANLMSYTDDEWNDIQFALEEAAPTRISMVQNYVSESEQYTPKNLQTAVDRFIATEDYLDLMKDYYDDYMSKNMGTYKTQTREFKQMQERLRPIGKAIYNKQFRETMSLLEDLNKEEIKNMLE